MSRELRAAVIFWEGYIGVAPSLINAARSLSAAGIRSDLFTRQPDHDFADPPDLGPIVDLVWCGRSSHPAGEGGRVQSTVERGRFLLRVLRRIWRRRYAVVIGVDAQGLTIARLVGLIKRARVVHWSLEIHPLPEASSILRRIWRNFQLKSYRRAAFTIVQDAHRGDVLAEEFGTPRQSILFVPNGPMGPPHRATSSELARRFAVDASAPIALHIGMISPRVLSLQLARMVEKWPSDWTLVFHERRQRDPDDPYLQKIAAAGGSRLHLSLEPVAYDQLDDLVASATVGLVIYDSTESLNFSVPGSSGKIGQYLKCGLPIVALDAPGISEVISSYECGVVVPHLEDIGEALFVLQADLDRFRENAFRCYQEVYEFGRHFRKVQRKIFPPQFNLVSDDPPDQIPGHSGR